MWVVNKRISRNLRAGKVKWIAILLIVVMCTYYMIAVYGSALLSQYNHAKNFRDNKARNGRFTALAELYDDELLKGEDLGFDIEKECYLDYPALENAKLRVFRNRTKLDLVFCDEGKLAENDSEIVLEKHFSRFNDIHVGDKVNIAGLEFTISGIGGAADAEYVFDIQGEVTDHKSFANGYVTEEGYERLRKTGKNIGSEVYRYGYRKHDESTKDGILEDYFRDMDFDAGRIENKYFKEMFSELMKSKTDLESSMKEMNDACDDLKSAANDFDDSAKDMCDAAEEFCDVVNNDLVSGISDLADGVEELDKNSGTLTDGADQIFELFLTNAENGLRDYGVNIDLTKDNYESALRSVNFSSASGQYSGTIDELISSLQMIESFCSGVHSYTEGVGQVRGGASELRSASDQLGSASEQFKRGLEQYAAVPEFAGAFEALNTGYGMIDEGLRGTSEGVAQLSSSLDTIDSGSAQLRDGADRIFDMMLSDISSRVSTYGVSVSLTRDNYASALNDVKGGLGYYVTETAGNSVNDLISSLNSYKEFSDGLKDYTDGVGQLHDGIKSLNDVIPDLIENSEALCDAAFEFADHTSELKDGVGEFSDAIGGFNDNMDELDEMFDYDYDIIESFEPLRFNTGIYNTAQSNIDTINTCVILIFLVIGFIFTVFISQDIDNDSAVIGALYSMGVQKRKLICHYMIIPVMIALVGGVLGTVAGISPIGIKMMNQSMESFYSLPKFVNNFDARLLLIGIVIPVLISSLISLVVITKKLSRSPLSLLRHERKLKKVCIGRLDRMTFLSAFRIKYFLTEIGTSLIVFIGMILSLSLLMYSMNYTIATKPAIEGAERDIKFEDLCVMKYAPKEVPEGAEKVYIESGSIGRCEVNIMGIEPDSKCFSFDVKNNSRNKISVGSGTALKYGLKAGDMFTVNSTDRHRYYTFEVENIVDFSPGLYVFMKIDDMRRTFGADSDYYNALISDKKIDIDQGRVFSYYSKESIVKSVKDSFESSSLSTLIFFFITIAVFMIITFLMIKLMIDRSRMNISLFRVFGYNRLEIKQLFIDGNFYLIVFSVLAGMPIAKLFVDKVWFPASSYGLDMGFDTRYPVWLYLLIVMAVIVVYIIVSSILGVVANKITVSEVLKNRE